MIIGTFTRLGASSVEQTTRSLLPGSAIQQQGSQITPPSTPPPVSDFMQPTCPACPRPSPWYVFVLLGALGGGLATAGGFMINASKKRKRRR